MINRLDHIAPRFGSVAFRTGPRYGEPQVLEMTGQRKGFDSDGNIYVYMKRSDIRCRHRVAWDNATRQNCADLSLFLQTANGTKHLFYWYDHNSERHQVRFHTERIDFKQTGPDRFSVSIEMEEFISLPLIDENGRTLIDENGNTLIW